jgi:hypothetical protein
MFVHRLAMNKRRLIRVFRVFRVFRVLIARVIIKSLLRRALP